MANEGSISNTAKGLAGAATPPSPAPADGADSALSTLGLELRRRREQLQLSVRRAAERCSVSPTVISEIERGQRLPTLRTVRRLREGLGLDPPQAVLLRRPAPEEPLEAHLVRLGACLWGMGGRVRLGELAAALELPAAAVREQLPFLAPRLAACGVELTEDSIEVHCRPVELAQPALEALGRATSERRRRVLSQEATVVMAYLGWHGEATRRELEAFRGDDCESLLRRLLDAGYITAVRDSEGPRPNRYRLTTLALEAMGVASLEELRERMAAHVDNAEGNADPAAAAS